MLFSVIENQLKYLIPLDWLHHNYTGVYFMTDECGGAKTRLTPHTNGIGTDYDQTQKTNNCLCVM